MGLFDRDYDRNYGYRGNDRGFRDRGGFMGSTGFDRERGSSNRGHFGERGMTGYDRNFRGRGYDEGFRGRGGYDQPYWGHDTWRYDEQYKSRQQTDFGDPFGDRSSNTPIRVIENRRDRGGWFGSSDYDRDHRYGTEYSGYGRDFRGYGREYRAGGMGYDREYGRNPVSYDPYETRGQDRDRLRGRTRGHDRGMTGDWF